MSHDIARTITDLVRRSHTAAECPHDGRCIREHEMLDAISDIIDKECDKAYLRGEMSGWLDAKDKLLPPARHEARVEQIKKDAWMCRTAKNVDDRMTVEEFATSLEENILAQLDDA